MTIDWPTVLTIAVPIITLFIGAALNRIIERRPKLIAYFTHASAYNLTGNNPMTVHTHGIVIRNVGRRAAEDIRVRHNTLPQNFRIFPAVENRVENLQDGAVEIIFPRLVPNEQISISYLYSPPLFFNQIHAGIRHSEGFATEVTALPTPQYPPWLRTGLWFFLILGAITFIYFVLKGWVIIAKLVHFVK